MSNEKMFRYEWIWEKSLPTGFLNARKMPLKVHENILVFYSKLPVYNPQFTDGKPYRKHTSRTSAVYDDFAIIGSASDGKRYPRDIIRSKCVRAGGEQTLIPTQKPTELLEYLIRTYTNEGQTVLDNCMGSGSTGVACVKTNRSFIGFELNDKHFEIAKKRIEEAQVQLNLT